MKKKIQEVLRVWGFFNAQLCCRCVCAQSSEPGSIATAVSIEFIHKQ